VRAGMRRARLEGRHIGRRSLEIDRVAVLQERARGQSLSEMAKTHCISRATVSRLLKQAKETAAPSMIDMIKRGAARHPPTPWI
jgi:DNA invertase Pin-like site-specific DNA recombinase